MSRGPEASEASIFPTLVELAIATTAYGVPASQVAGARYAEPLMKHLDSER